MMQSRDLVMVALGSREQSPRWFGAALEDGIHLRWTFRSELGYPFGGFQLYRRPHVAGTPVDVPMTGIQGGVIELPAVARRVVAEFDSPFWHRLLRPRQPLPGIVGLFEGVESSTSTASLAQARVSLQNDAISAIRITTPGHWRLRRLRYVPVSQDEETGWIAVRPICLPVTDPKYPCHAGPVNPSADREEARSRIAGQDGQPDPEVVARYLDPVDWQEFHEQVRTLFDPPIPASLALSSDDLEQARAGTSTVDLTLLAAVDPYFARILGLYWLDRSAQLGQSYDYKLAGRWLKSQLKAPETTLDFEADKAGRRYVVTFLREGVIVRSFHKGSIEAVAGAPWKDTRLALDLHPFFPSAIPNAPAYLRLQFPEAVAEVQLYLRIHQGQPQLAASIADITVSTWKAPAGDFMILTIAATKPSERIEFVTLNPITGSGSLHLSVCKIGILRDWSAPLSEERAWITYDVRSAPPEAMPAPTGLTVEPLAGAARELPNGIVAAAPRAGLRWHVPATTLLPGQAVRYLIERQPLGSGDVADPIVSSPWEPVNLDAPVGIPDEEDGAGHFYFDDPSVPTGFADRFYGYRMAGIDLFGRLSPPSAPIVVDLSDRQAPPPPADVEATYRESDGSLHVRWNWSPGQRVQAPDAREFRIYAQRGRLNTVTGRITALQANSDGTVTVTTDGTLETGAADAFAGEWLLNGGIYFDVIHNTAGAQFQLTVRAPSAPPPARPAVGPFTLSIRPRRPLEGVVVKARSHLFGEVTLKTDQHAEVGMNTLAGKWLRQGGRRFRILANTSGENLRLTVKGLGLPPRVPGKGRFTVVEQDGTTPFLADAGNVLHRDYRRSENWAERVHVESVASPIAGGITAVAVDSASGTSTVTTDHLPNDPQHRFAGGMLSNDGQVFRVLAHEEGPPLVLTVANLAQENGTILVPASGPFVYHMGYQATFAFGLAHAPGEGVAYAQVAVSTADDKDHVPDAPRWNGTALGGRPGNEGMVSSPILLQKSLGYVEDERPDAPDVGEGLATAADYHGHSFIEVRWQARAGMRVEVYRALDEALFATDPDTGGDPSDEELQALAELPANESAFGLLTARPVETDAFRATMDGRASNRHCFAIRFIDAAGNRGPLSHASRPVRAPKTLEPRAPLITNVLGGDRNITLRWASNREPDLKEYQIYRADSEESAGDPRLMRLVHAQSVSGDPSTRPAEIEWTDDTVRPRVTYRYHVVAVDNSGNRSVRGDVVAAQAYDQRPPDPPEWVGAARNASGGIALSWSASDLTLQAVVLRRHSAAWMPVSPWLPPGVTSFTDSTALDATELRYRLRVRNEAGNVNIAYHEVLVPAP